MALFTPTSFFANLSGSITPSFYPTDLGTPLYSWLSAQEGSWNRSTGNITSITDLGSGGSSWYVGGGSGTSYASNFISGVLTYQGQASNAYFADFDGAADYWQRSSMNMTDGSGNTYVVGMFYHDNADQQNDSIWSIDGTRNVQLSSNTGATSWSGVFDMNGISSTFSLSWFSDNGSTRNYVDNWNIYSFIFNKTGNQIFGRTNGYSLSNVVSYSNSMSTGNFKIAVNRNSNRRLELSMTDIMIVRDKPGTSSNTSLENLYKLEGWLAWTYGRQSALNPSHPYAGAAPRSGS